MNAKDPSGSPGLTQAIADFAFGSQAFTHGSRPLAWLSPDEMDIDLADERQRRFGDYELLERIGQGGFGTVYRGRHVHTLREVAIKLLDREVTKDPSVLQRFEREAQVVSAIKSRHVVEVYDIVTETRRKFDVVVKDERLSVRVKIEN